MISKGDHRNLQKKSFLDNVGLGVDNQIFIRETSDQIERHKLWFDACKAPQDPTFVSNAECCTAQIAINQLPPLHIFYS